MMSNRRANAGCLVQAGAMAGCCLLLSAGHAPAAEEAGRTRLSVGPVYRGGMQMEASGRSEAGGFYRPSGHRTADAGANPDTLGTGERTFDDGFVGIDSLTAADGRTQVWGYENASQYDPAAETVAFHRLTEVPGSEGTARSVSTLQDGTLDADDGFWGMGVGLGAERTLTVWHGLSVGAGLRLNGFWSMDGCIETTTLRQRVTDRRYVDEMTDTYVYNRELTTFPNVPMPSAPYSATDPNVVNGNPMPLLFNAPASATRTVEGGVLVGSSSWLAENRVALDMESDLYQLEAGPVLDCQPASAVRLTVRPVVSLNALDADLSLRETFEAVHGGSRQTVASWNEHSSDTEWLWGFGVKGGIEVALTDRVSIGVQGGYEWIEEACFDVGPYRVGVDVSGYTAGCEAILAF